MERRAVAVDQARMSLALWLRQGRAQRGMSLEDVAKVTKIQPRILERLEAGKFDGLPADVFVRGFVRSIARCVGLTEAEALSRYEACGAATPGASASVSVPTTARAFVESMSELAPHTARAAASSPQILRADGEAGVTASMSGPIEIVEIDVAELADPEAPMAQGSLRLVAMPALAIGTSESEIVPPVALDLPSTTLDMPVATAANTDAETTQSDEPTAPIVAAAVEAPAKKKRTRKPRATASVPTTTVAADATEQPATPAPRRRRKAKATVSPLVVAPAETVIEAAPIVEAVSAAEPVAVSASDSVSAAVSDTVSAAVSDTVSATDSVSAAVLAAASASESIATAEVSTTDAIPTAIDEFDLWAPPPPASDPIDLAPTAETFAAEHVSSDASGSGTWTPRMPAVIPAAPWRRPSFAHAIPAVPTLVIDDADPSNAEREVEDRQAARAHSRRSFLPPILLDREDRSGRQGGLTLAVIILLIAATLTLSYLMRRPGTSGDGMTALDVPTQPIA